MKFRKTMGAVALALGAAGAVRPAQAKDLEIEDLRDRYLTSYETAAHRFTNLATKHLDIPMHFMKINSAGIIYKVVYSATSNAENNAGADVDELKVRSIMVDEGPILKRFMARAKGRGTQIFKRTSHISVVVGSGK